MPNPVFPFGPINSFIVFIIVPVNFFFLQIYRTIICKASLHSTTALSAQVVHCLVYVHKQASVQEFGN